MWLTDDRAQTIAIFPAALSPLHRPSCLTVPRNHLARSAIPSRLEFTMRKRIQIANLNDAVDDQALAALFALYGPVHAATVATHPQTGVSTGVGFVEMQRKEDGDSAIAALHGRKHLGQPLSVCWSEAANKLKLEAGVGPQRGGFGDRRG